MLAILCRHNLLVDFLIHQLLHFKFLLVQFLPLYIVHIHLHFVNLSLCKYVTFSILISSTVTLLILNFDKVGVDKMRSLHMGTVMTPPMHKCKPHEVYYATTSDENFTGHR